MRPHRPVLPALTAQAIVLTISDARTILLTAPVVMGLTVIVPVLAPRVRLKKGGRGPHAYGFRPRLEEDPERLSTIINVTVAMIATALTATLVLAGVPPWTAVSEGALVSTLALPLTYAACTRIEVKGKRITVIEVYGTTELAETIPLEPVVGTSIAGRTLILEGVRKKITLNDPASLAREVERVINDEGTRT